jgi:hypothetical protein
MAEYEFQIIGGDGSRLWHERFSLADPSNAWERVFALAKSRGAPGSEVRVLDHRGEIVIGVGVATAAEMVRMRKNRRASNASLRTIRNKTRQGDGSPEPLTE